MPGNNAVNAKEAEHPAVQVEIVIPRRSPIRAKPVRTKMPATLGGDSEQYIPPRIPRVTRLMALAIKFQEMVDRGEVHDYADLARLGYVTRARLTQIMNLLLLAPDIQEGILLNAEQRHRVHEHALRSIASCPFWYDQRKLWARKLASGANLSH